MVFGVVLRVIGSKVKQSAFNLFLGKNLGITPLGFGKKN